MKTFPTAIDGIVVALLMLPLTHLVHTVWVSGSNIGALVVPVLGLGLIYKAFLFPITYVFSETALIVKFGWFKNEIKYSDIVEIFPSRALWAAPALSLKRIRIVTSDGGGTLLSPVDRDRFVAELKRNVPGLISSI